MHSYRSILSRIDPAIKHPDNVEPPTTTVGYRVPILGFSATFSRHDGLALGSVFEEIVYHRDFLEMIKEQWYASTDFQLNRARDNIQLQAMQCPLHHSPREYGPQRSYH